MNKQYKGVVISSGHHGKGMCLPGACSHGYIEAKLAKELMAEIAKYLTVFGVDVHTFADEKGTSVSTNITNITNYHLTKGKAYLHISIHFNAANSNASGAEVLYRGDMGDLASEFSVVLSDTLGIKNRGKKARTDLGFLNKLSLRNYDPLLFEICFIDSVSDMRKYEENIDALADNIASKIANLCGASSPSSQKQEKQKKTENSQQANAHTVESGDTLYSIARKYDVSVADLLRLNPVKFGGAGKDTVLKIGWHVVYKK